MRDPPAAACVLPDQPQGYAADGVNDTGIFKGFFEYPVNFSSVFTRD
jgi:hypothetical protein